MNEPTAERPYEVPEVITWSFSAYKDFVNCPQKYYRTRVVKDCQTSSSPALVFGKQVHSHLEVAVRDGTDYPGGGKLTERMQKIVDRIRSMKGFKLVEYEMAVTPDLMACDFNDEGRWWRGIADLIVIHEDQAIVMDYKTGASMRYADTDQLKLLSAALCVHWPEVQRVRGALLFTELDGVVPMPAMTRDEALAQWTTWRRNLHPLRVAYESNVWNTRKSGLCRFCPVKSCLHHPDNN